MRITYAEMQRRLASEKNIANGVEFRDSSPVPVVGQRSGKPNVPQPIRDLAGALAHVPGARQEDIAAELGVTQESVSHFKHEKSAGKEEHLDAIKDHALRRLMSSLNLLTDEKLEDCNAKELSGIAVNMSRVHQSLSPQQAAGDKVNLIVYSPQLRDESKFKVVEVEST